MLCDIDSDSDSDCEYKDDKEMSVSAFEREVVGVSGVLMGWLTKKGELRRATQKRLSRSTIITGFCEFRST